MAIYIYVWFYLMLLLKYSLRRPSYGPKAYMYIVGKVVTSRGTNMESRHQVSMVLGTKLIVVNLEYVIFSSIHAASLPPAQ